MTCSSSSVCGDLDDSIVACASIDAVCHFFLTAPVMCRSIASNGCRSLVPPLIALKSLRKNRTTKGPSATEPLPDEPELGDSVSAGNDELVVRLFHSGFMVFAACQRWGVVSSPEASFANCCGGIVKLEREELLARCIEAVNSSLSACNWGSVRTSFSASDAEGLNQFLGAIIQRHPRTSAAISSVKLLVLLGGLMLLDNQPPSSTEEDEEGNCNQTALQGAFIQLVAGGTCLQAIKLINSRNISVVNWFATDIDVLLEALRRLLALETRSVEQQELSAAIRVVLKDTLPSTIGDDAQGLALWLSRLNLHHDYLPTWLSKGITCTHLRGNLGRLEIVEVLGIDDAADADILFRVLSD